MVKRRNDISKSRNGKRKKWPDTYKLVDNTNKKKRSVFINFFILAAVALFICSGYFIYKYGSDDQRNIEYPKPTNYKYINDYSGAINEGVKDYIVSVGKEIEDKTTAELVICLVDSLEGKSIDRYSNELFNKWGIGNKDSNNGLLILVAVNDRKWRVEVGKGLESKITDEYSSKVMNDIAKPFFKKKEYGEGLKRVYSIFAQDIAKKYSVSLNKGMNAGYRKSENVTEASGDATGIFYSIVFIVIIGAGYVIGKNNTRGKKNGKRRKGDNTDSDWGWFSDFGDGGSSDFGGGSSDGGGSSGDW